MPERAFVSSVDGSYEVSEKLSTLMDLQRSCCGVSFSIKAIAPPQCGQSQEHGERGSTAARLADGSCSLSATGRAAAILRGAGWRGSRKSESGQSREAMCEAKTAAETPRQLRHQPLLAFVSVIFPSEGDFAIGDVHNPVVGNRDAIGIAGQIVEDMFGSPEWAFGVDDPIVAKRRPQKLVERFLLGKLFHRR